MRKRIFPLMVVVMIMISMMVTTASAAVSLRAISGRPTLRISGTTAYCVGKYSSGNKNDEIAITITLKQGEKIIDSWSASGKGKVGFQRQRVIILAVIEVDIHRIHILRAGR